MKRRRLDHRLKSAVPPEDRSALRAFAEGLAARVEAAPSA